LEQRRSLKRLGDKLLYVQLRTSPSIAGHTFCGRAR